MEQILWCMKSIHKSLHSLLTPHTSQAWVLLNRGGSRTTSWRDLTVRQSPRRWSCRGLRRNWSVLSKWCEGWVFGALSFLRWNNLDLLQTPSSSEDIRHQRDVELDEIRNVRWQKTLKFKQKKYLQYFQKVLVPSRWIWAQFQQGNHIPVNRVLGFFAFLVSLPKDLFF